MADFPGGVYSPRAKENKAGTEYDPARKTISYVEDVTKLDDEVVAVETFLSPKLLTLRPEINIDEIKKEAVPVQTQRGVFFGYILPIYNDDHQELFFKQRVPFRWDGVSNIRSRIKIALGNAEDVGDKFNLQLSWEHAPMEEPVPDTSNDVPVETAVLIGRNAAFDLYAVTFIIDYDIDGVGNEIKPYELLVARLRRIAASELEISNSPIVLDWVTEYQRNKFGASF